MEVIEGTAQIYANYGIETEIIVASIRHPIHVYEAALIGADIATIPPDVLDKMVNHPLTNIGIKKFLDDWKKVPKK
jgi:transaldolase